ncbi:class I SAM-dependent methyltransferase [Candidatus Dojkabacteria bacterium]|uniref:Class I SAM-dependent methyltransferase n=1 Tax=Candidatus Dojkabacteria bacterium TaxID=2099670 RepID=A0A955I7A3_9BACT|nr:class I SAM-dependent methyltransferase [Candidatus Dojkabacteria bacterium]
MGDPNKVAKAVYGSSGANLSLGQKTFNLVFGNYPEQYEHVVARSRAKIDQYRDMVGLIPRPEQGRSSFILEPGPSMLPLLESALRSAGWEEGTYSVVKIDKYSEMTAGGSNVIIADFERLPIADNSVDVVFISSVLLYISDKEAAISEAYRIVRPGGRIIVSELDGNVDASTLSSRVMLYEINSIWNDINESMRGTNNLLIKIRFYKAIIERFGPNIRYMIGAILRNILVLKDMEELPGFSAEGLECLLSFSGFSGIDTYRTYADSYHLVVGEKEG